MTSETSRAGCASATSRRRFLGQLVVLSSGSAILAGCSSGCSSRGGATTGRTVPIPPPVAPTPWKPTPPGAEPVIRVRIALIESSGSVTIDSPTGWVGVRDQSDSLEPLLIPAPVTIADRGGRWAVTDRTGADAGFSGGENVEVSPDPQAGSLLEFDGVRYPGSLATARTGRGFDVINRVPVDRYLPGVLSRELYAHWHAEAFAAQSIAARSYACFEIQFHSTRRHFDVTNTQASQAYAGATTLAVANEAVARTRGQVLSWRGQLVPGYYSSCCGGVAARAADAIADTATNDLPPLQSRSSPNACTGAPVYRWTQERSVSDVSKRVAAWALANNEAAVASLGDIRLIETATTNPHGRPTSFTLTDGSGRTATVLARRFREMVDYTPAGEKAPSPMRSSFVRITVSGDSMVFVGRGYGHGAGMCQYCAQALALQGMSHAAMLDSFYPGAELIRAYA